MTTGPEADLLRGIASVGLTFIVLLTKHPRISEDIRGRRPAGERMNPRRGAALTGHRLTRRLAHPCPHSLQDLLTIRAVVVSVGVEVVDEGVRYLLIP